jgi:pSer/pThr/pTyr-binding forkhead associated (FHA) protein
MPSDDLPEGTDPGVAPVGGTVVTDAPADDDEPEPERPQRPQPRQAPRAAAPAKRRPQPANEEEEEPLPAEDPRATRILSVESIDAPVKFELLVTAGPARGGRFPLHSGTLTVGRSAQCDCSILDEAISRRHFELQVDSHGVLLRDLGSGNGTLVNGERADEVNLTHGDVLNIGDSTLELRERGRAPVSATAHSKGRAPTAARMPVAKGSPRGKGGQNRRTLLIGLLAVGVMFIVILGFMKVKAKQQAIAQATAAFERGRQELEQGNADEALEDFQRAIVAYPDPNIIQEKAAIARVISDGNKALTHARDLIDQKDFSAAGKVLDAVPHNDYLDAQVKTIRDDIEKRQAELKKAELEIHANGVPIDPMTAAEAHDYWQKAKKEPLDAANTDMGHAYDMLASKGAGGEEFDQLKLDYVEILKQIYVRYKRSSPAKAELALEKANSIVPDAIPPGGPAVAKPAEAPGKATTSKHSHHEHTTRAPTHHHTAATSNSSRSNGSSATPAAGGGGGARYDEAHAEELDDAGDSLLGQNPDGAKAKYREALKYAPPDSEAANRARAGLSN